MIFAGSGINRGCLPGCGNAPAANVHDIANNFIPFTKSRNVGLPLTLYFPVWT